MKNALLAALLGFFALAATGCNCTCNYLRCLRDTVCSWDPCPCQPCGCSDCVPPPCDCGHEGCGHVEYGHDDYGHCDCGHGDYGPVDAGRAGCGLSLGCLDCCNQGCGERYYGDWAVGDHCDPCDCHGNWVGPSRYHGHPVGHPDGYDGPIMPGPRVIGSRPKEPAPTPVQR